MNKKITSALFIGLLSANLSMLAMNETFAVCGLKEKPFWWQNKTHGTIQLPPEAEIQFEMLKLFPADGSWDGKDWVERFVASIARMRKTRYCACEKYVGPDSPWAVIKFVTRWLDTEIFALTLRIGGGMVDDETIKLKCGLLVFSASELAAYNKLQEMFEKRSEIVKVLLKNHPQEIQKFSQDLKRRPMPDYNEIMKY